MGQYVFSKVDVDYRWSYMNANQHTAALLSDVLGS